MPDKRRNPGDQEISWRTEELGPEMRRRLFEKLIPSQGRAGRRDGPVPTSRDPEHSERPKSPRQGS